MDYLTDVINEVSRFVAELSPAATYEIGAALALACATLFMYLRGRRIEQENHEQYQTRLKSLEAEIVKAAAASAPISDEADESKAAAVGRDDPTFAEPQLTNTLPFPAIEAPSLSPKAEPVIDAKSAVSAGLKKSRSAFFGRLRSLFVSQTDIKEVLAQFEELLITSDLGVRTTQAILSRVEERLRSGAALEEEVIAQELRELLTDILKSDSPSGIRAEKVGASPKVVLIVGVNGVGKTTTIGKLATRFREEGARVLIAACDTFRAAAVEQLDVWAQRSGVDIERGADGAKPSTVAYQSAERAVSGGYDVLIVDTAGRLHTRVNLMNELASVVTVLEQKIPGSPHETLLVLDAVTGQNGLQQAREFHEKAKLTGVVVTKLDGTPKGGIVVAIKQELGIPIRYIGVGEQIHDLREFSAADFVDGLLSRDDVEDTASDSVGGERPRVRRRRQEAAGGA